jgi:hypothetical protein
VLRRAGSPTGDLVRQDKDGYFFFVSCEKDIIRRRGENESAAELERMIGARMRGEKGDAFHLRQLRLLVGLGKFPLPSKFRSGMPTGSEPAPPRKGLLTLAVARFFLISRCKRRAHAAF